MHMKRFLHNDLKSDNIVLFKEIHSVIIDFGWCRSSHYPKRYSLTAREQTKYEKPHRHIAPEHYSVRHTCAIFQVVYVFLWLYYYSSGLLNDVSIACVPTDPAKSLH